MYIKLGAAADIPFYQFNEDEPEQLDEKDLRLLDLFKSAAASECQQIAFDLPYYPFNRDMYNRTFRRFRRQFKGAKEVLSPAEYFKFTNEQIQAIAVCQPLDDLSILDLQHLEGLTDLSVRHMTPQDLANFQFPPNLTTLECGAGFPTFEYLPLTLTILSFYNLRCGLDELERSLALLSNHCVNLEQLSMSYACYEPKSPVASGNDHPIKFRSSILFLL